MQSLPKGLRVTLCPTDMSEYTAQVCAGLLDLRARGEIRLALRRLRQPLLRTPHSVFLELSAGGLCRTLRVFIDLVDTPGLHAEALAGVDVYVKRSLRAAMPAAQGSAAVIAYGLQFAARTEALTGFARAALHWQASFRGGVVYSPIERMRSAAGAASRLFRGRGIAGDGSPRPLASIEASPDRKAPLVFFATRVYGPEEAPHAADRETVNNRRADLIRALRARFGDRYVGGLRPSSHALQTYPDCVYRVEDNRAWHHATGKRALVHVNSHGLHGSTGWKFAEALAQQSCLVTEPTLDVLPVPLVAGRHCLTFGSVDDCLDQCAFLLANPASADALRHAGKDYYLGNVQPAALVRNLLHRACHVAHAHAR